MDIYTLSYINFDNGATLHYDQQFETIIKLMAWVNTHANVSSYQIIVVRK